MANSGEQEKLTFCQKAGNEFASFRKFLYNSEEKTVLGRSGKSWAKIGVFYLIFYGCLAGFFSAMLAVFMSTLNKPGEGGPKLTQFIKNQAGLTAKTNLGPLKNFDSSNEDAAAAFADANRKLFEGFKNGDVYDGVCDPQNTGGIPANEKPCYMNNTLFEDCSPDIANTTFGFAEKKPCVFIKINKVYDWVPSGDGGYLKLDCTCDEATGCVAGVYPPGFLLAGFPFRGQKEHELPLVAVQIDASKTGSSGRVQCQLVGDDIEVSESYNPTRSFGKIRIEDVYAQ